MYSTRGNNSSTEWIAATGEWVSDHVNDGRWEGYYVNIMFDALPADGDEMHRRMRRAIEKFYGRFSTEFHQHPRSPGARHRIPRLFLFPDRPVRKSGLSAKEIAINDGGVHYNGPMLIPTLSRFHGCLLSHLDDHQSLYARHGIRRIHAKKIDNAAGMADYAVKTLNWNRADEADIIVLPRTVSELDAVRAEMSPLARAIRDVESALNLSPEVARNLVLRAMDCEEYTA